MALKYVRDLLVATPAVSAIVGKKVYPVLVPEDAAPPYVSLARISTTPVNHLRGFGSLDQHTVDVGCYSTSYADLLVLRDAVRTCLQAAGSIMETELEDYDSMVRVYHVSQHWQIWT